MNGSEHDLALIERLNKTREWAIVFYCMQGSKCPTRDALELLASFSEK